MNLPLPPTCSRALMLSTRLLWWWWWWSAFRCTRWCWISITSSYPALFELNGNGGISDSENSYFLQAILSNKRIPVRTSRTIEFEYYKLGKSCIEFQAFIKLFCWAWMKINSCLQCNTNWADVPSIWNRLLSRNCTESISVLLDNIQIFWHWKIWFLNVKTTAHLYENDGTTILA